MKTFAIDFSVPSVPLDRVGMVVSQGCYTFHHWDTASSQIVQVTQNFSVPDLEREKAWLIKSERLVQGSKLYCLLPHAVGDRLKTGGEPRCPAWNRDIMWLLLLLILQFKERELHEIPLRVVPDSFAVAETIRRLTAMQCLVDQGSQTWTLSSFGSTALDVREKLPTINIHVAMLFARSGDTTLPLQVRRVMIRLAALIHYDIESFCDVTPDAEMPSLTVVQQQCVGIGRDQARKGHLWVTLGVYLKVVSTGWVSRGAEEADLLTFDDWLGIDLKTAYEIRSTVRDIENAFGIPELTNANEVRDTMLSEDQIKLVETEFVLCYMHRVMCVSITRDTVFDVASNQPMTYPDTGFCHINELRTDPRNRELGAFFAVYLELTRPLKSGLVATGLVVVPQHIFKEVKDRCGMKWPDIVQTSYPLHR